MRSSFKSIPAFQYHICCLFLATAVLLTACAVPVQKQPRGSTSGTVVVEPVETVEQDRTRDTISGAQSFPIDNTEAAFELIRRAETLPSPERESNLLDAVETLLNTRQYSTARTVLENLSIAGLPEIFGLRKQVLLARSEQARNNHEQALAMLDGLNVAPDTHPILGAEVLLRQAESLQALRQNVPALERLVERQRYLDTPNALEDNARQIWELINVMDNAQLLEIRNAANNDVMRGWADLGLIHLQFSSDPYRLENEIDNWRSLYPTHIAGNIRLHSHTLSDSLGFGATKNIALLLPMSSNFGRAAQAVHDGFMAMHNANSDPYKPQVVLYDIGQEPDLVPFYYNVAIDESADFIVGPLGKDAVNNLISSTTLLAPTLLLGALNPNVLPPVNSFQFSLQPEQEAQQVARRAFLDGHRIAAVLYPNTEWGQRVQSAFRTAWQEIGGLVAETQIYQPGQADYSPEVKALLNIDSSQSRHSLVAGVAGSRLEFTPRRRSDLDFIFMAASSREGRLLKPGISFHQGHNLPVYATSKVYSGTPNRINDIDLNGVIFGDMPWLLIASGRYAQLKSSLSGSLSTGPMARLFALGVDAYSLGPQLETMRADPSARLSGATASLSLSETGRVERQLIWAQFVNGVPKLLDEHGHTASNQ